MSLTKQIVVDLIEVTINNVVQVRTKTLILEDDVELSGSFHRHTVIPGQDYSEEDPRVQAICAAIHTPAVIAAYQDATVV